MCFIIRTLFYHEPLTLRELSKLANCSLSKTSRKIEELNKEGLVSVSVKGRAYLLRANLQHPLLKYILLREEAEYTALTLKKYPELVELLEELLKKCDGEIVLLFGSYARHEATDTSDVDVAVINGKGGEFNLSYEEFRKLMKNKNNTMMSIIKHHVIVKGFEKFIDEVMKWKTKKG